LPLLYLSVFGVGTFFGNLMSTSFVGDFSAAAIALSLPMTVRYAISLPSPPASVAARVAEASFCYSQPLERC
jgi:O-antigen/teichoic acid export membrane protein